GESPTLGELPVEKNRHVAIARDAIAPDSGFRLTWRALTAEGRVILADEVDGGRVAIHAGAGTCARAAGLGYTGGRALGVRNQVRTGSIRRVIGGSREGVGERLHLVLVGAICEVTP